ncbi:hypothetical protein [Streptomyces sp. NPDC001530]|uniref:hypothetical protein n=1 Tax=Streptomyces sp. NPDC001530 TaxID=3364582 RepID=UPI0036818414
MINLPAIRTEIQRARNWAGRAATLAGTAALTASLYTSQALTVTAPWIIGATVLGALLARPWRTEMAGAVTAVYCTPAVLLLAEMAVFTRTEGIRWWEPVAAGVWVVGVWYVRPARYAASTVRPASAAQTLLVARTAEQQLINFWERNVACDGGYAPGSHLENPRVHGARDFRAEIVAPGGKPVPDIPTDGLSALMDIPAELIKISPVKGRGAGRRQLTVASPEGASQHADVHQAWAGLVAPKAMPGSILVKIRRGSTKTGEIA